jgi:hypothetical protein
MIPPLPLCRIALSARWPTACAPPRARFAELLRPLAPPEPTPARPGLPREHRSVDRDRREPRDEDTSYAREAPRAELDPLIRQTAQLAAPENPVARAAPDVAARVSMDELLPQLVRRIAWAGDRRRGSVQLELGSGAVHDGTVITVHADDGRVRVELGGPGADALRERIGERLRARGIDVESVD